jgi:hypothetical protein
MTLWTGDVGTQRTARRGRRALLLWTGDGFFAALRMTMFLLPSGEKSLPLKGKPKKGGRFVNRPYAGQKDMRKQTYDNVILSRAKDLTEQPCTDTPARNSSDFACPQNDALDGGRGDAEDGAPRSSRPTVRGTGGGFFAALRMTLFFLPSGERSLSLKGKPKKGGRFVNRPYAGQKIMRKQTYDNVILSGAKDLTEQPCTDTPARNSSDFACPQNDALDGGRGDAEDGAPGSSRPTVRGAQGTDSSLRSE